MGACRPLGGGRPPVARVKKKLKNIYFFIRPCRPFLKKIKKKNYFFKKRPSVLLHFTSCVVIPRNNVKYLKSSTLDTTISIVLSANESNFLFITKCVMISSIILDFSSAELEAVIGLCCNINKIVSFKVYNSIFYYTKNILTCKASPLHFSSLLSFFLNFWWIFVAQMKGEGGLMAFIEWIFMDPRKIYYNT